MDLIILLWMLLVEPPCFFFFLVVLTLTPWYSSPQISPIHYDEGLLKRNAKKGSRGMEPQILLLSGD